MPRASFAPILFLDAIAALVIALTPVQGGARTYKSGRNQAAFPTDATKTFAFRVAQMNRQTCFGELARRRIVFQVVPSAPGVRAPVRLGGPLGSVRFINGLAQSARKHLPWEILDCRLVLALNEWAQILSAHDVSEVVFSSGWRPSKQAANEGVEGKRHAGALAMDVHLLRLRSGGELNIERDFGGKLGAPVCGPDAQEPNPDSREARQLRSIVCSSAELRLFQSILTPNFDVHHANHLHVEVTPNVRWFILS